MPTAHRRITVRDVSSTLGGCLVAFAATALGDPPVERGPTDAAAAPAAAPLRSHILPVGDIAATGRHLPSAGMVTARAPDIIREQLALPRGRGLVVMSVAPDSLAARAGICRHDVLVALDGQWLLLPEHLEALIDSSPSDAALECNLIRGGKPVSVSLSGRPVAGASGAWPQPRGEDRAAAPPLPSVMVDAPPDGAADRAGTVTSAGGSSVATTPSTVVPAGASQPLTAAAVGDRLDDGTLVDSGPDYTIKLTPGAGLKLLVQDRRGRVLFHGPIDTPAQRARMPLPVRPRVEALEREIAAREYRAQPGARVATRPHASGDTARATPEPQASRGTAPGETPTLPVAPVDIR